MKTQNFRRSNNVEDYTDPNKSVPPPDMAMITIAEVLKLRSSQLAKDAGIDDVEGKKG